MGKVQKIEGPTKTNESNTRRIDSVNRMKMGFQFQKSAIREALANIDKRKPIYFNSDSEGENNEGSNEPIEKKTKKDTEVKMTLFEDHDEEQDMSLNIPSDLGSNVEKTKKFLELKSMIPDTDRFKITPKFLEDDNSDKDSEISSHSKHSGEEKEANSNITEEKQKELAVLNEILGRAPAIEQKKKKEKSGPTKMLRFDPTQPEHSIFEIQNQQVINEKTKRKTGEASKVKETIEETVPEVSKNVFYEVKENLKDAFKEQTSFSFLNNEYEENEDEEVQIDHKSDDYDDQCAEHKQKNKPQEMPAQQQIRMPSSFVMNEPFFFQKDDYRLQEGRDFMSRFEHDAMDEFLKTRRNLKVIAKLKVKRLQSKTTFHKRSGNTRNLLKRKRAMKNA